MSEDGPQDPTQGFDSRPDSREKPLTQIGPYKILELIESGGMGSVYLAEQKEPVRRRVAIKVIKRGMDSEQVLRRFELERQALAVMNHPNIAKVFDGGITDGDQPFFVMEFVEGIPLTDYCDKHRLTIAERIGVFQQICAGVQHAHQKGVIHRDLKPGNVLVQRDDEQAIPKIIDFGLARATDHQLLARTAFTEKGMLLGTPEYMSPEQATMDGEGVDTRTDVYSLGVILYELLTGDLPFSSEELRQAGLLEIYRTIKEVDPPKPSTKISSAGEASSTWAEKRRTSVPGLSRGLRGDLDWIVMRALAKEPERRYESASGLALDLSRHLAHEPVLAGPPSAGYRLSKLLRRYRLQFAAAVVVLLALTASTVSVSLALADTKAAEQLAADRAAALDVSNQELQTALGEATRAKKAADDAREAEALQRQAAEDARKQEERQRQEAEQRAEELEIVSEFQASQLRDLDPEKMGADLRAGGLREARQAWTQRRLGEEESAELEAELEQLLAGANFTNLGLVALDENVFQPALKAIGEEFGEQPLVEARLLTALGSTLQDLGLLSLAEVPKRRSLELRRRVLGDDHPDTLTSMNNLGSLLKDQDKLNEAEPLFREALEAQRRVLGDDHPDTLTSIGNLGYLLMDQGKLNEAEPLFRETLEGSRRVLGDNHPDTLSSINNLGFLLQGQGKFTEAEPIFREALEAQRRVLGDAHPSTLVSIDNLGNQLMEQGKLNEAEPLLRETLEARRRVLGDDHPRTRISTGHLGRLLMDQGKLNEAEPLLRETLDGCRRVLGDDHPYTLASINDLADLLRGQGKLTEAEPLYRHALEVSRRVRGDDHKSTLAYTTNLGSLLREQRRLTEAQPLLQEALAKSRRVLGDDHPNTLASINSLGSLLMDQGKLTEAEPLYREALDGVRRVLGDDHPHTLTATNNLADLLQKQGKLTEAEPLFREALEGRRRVLGDDHPSTLNSINNLADLLYFQGKPNEAEPLIREALERRRRLLGDDHLKTLNTIGNLGALLVDQSKFTEAEPVLREALGAKRRVLGDDHPSTSRSAVWLVRLFAAQATGMREAGDHKEAETILVQGYETISDVVGTAHEESQKLIRELVALYEAWHAADPELGKDEEASFWREQLGR